ncbi:MAG: TfoX/Sxy family protein [Leptothrix sp. (in: b-proteobacteria)]
MATQPRTIDYLLEQMSQAGVVTARKMFGEYALYCDQLFIKPTAAGRAFIGQVTEAAPYPGAKPSWLISGERWDDRDWLSQLVKVSAAELPIPIKKARAPRPAARATK